MDKEEYYKRMSKIDAMVRTDRTSVDEDYHIACQRYYLSSKYIKTLEQENKQLKDNWNKLKEELNDLRARTFIKYNSNEWNNCLSFNDDILPIINKMQELERGEE